MSKPKSSTPIKRELVFTIEYVVEVENAGLEAVNIEAVMEKLRESGNARVTNAKIRKKATI